MHFGFTNKVTATITYNTPNQTLNGKKIIITGGGRGLGSAMAEKFVKEGAEVSDMGRLIMGDIVYMTGGVGNLTNDDLTWWF